MFCTWCKDRCQDDTRYKCNFTEGCDYPKVDAIQKHKQRMHITKNEHEKFATEEEKNELVVLKLVGHRVCLMTGAYNELQY